MDSANALARASADASLGHSRSILVPGIDLSLPPPTAPLSALDSQLVVANGSVASGAATRAAPLGAQIDAEGRFDADGVDMQHVVAGTAVTGGVTCATQLDAPVDEQRALDRNDPAVEFLAETPAPEPTGPVLAEPSQEDEPVVLDQAGVPEEGKGSNDTGASAESSKGTRPKVRWSRREVQRLLDAIAMAGDDMNRVVRLVGTRGKSSVRKQLAVLAKRVGGSHVRNSDPISASTAIRLVLAHHRLPFPARGAPEKPAAATTEPTRKVCVRVVAGFARCADVLRGMGRNPCQEIVVSPRKSVWDLLSHLYGKWGRALCLQDTEAVSLPINMTVAALREMHGVEENGETVVNLTYTLLDVDFNFGWFRRVSRRRQRVVTGRDQNGNPIVELVPYAVVDTDAPPASPKDEAQAVSGGAQNGERQDSSPQSQLLTKNDEKNNELLHASLTHTPDSWALRPLPQSDAGKNPAHSPGVGPSADNQTLADPVDTHAEDAPVAAADLPGFDHQSPSTSEAPAPAPSVTMAQASAPGAKETHAVEGTADADSNLICGSFEEIDTQFFSLGTPCNRKRTYVPMLYSEPSLREAGRESPLKRAKGSTEGVGAKTLDTAGKSNYMKLDLSSWLRGDMSKDIPSVEQLCPGREPISLSCFNGGRSSLSLGVRPVHPPEKSTHAEKEAANSKRTSSGSRCVHEISSEDEDDEMFALENLRKAGQDARKRSPRLPAGQVESGFPSLSNSVLGGLESDRLRSPVCGMDEPGLPETDFSGSFSGSGRSSRGSDLVGALTDNAMDPFALEDGFSNRTSPVGGGICNDEAANLSMGGSKKVASDGGASGLSALSPLIGVDSFGASRLFSLSKIDIDRP